MNKAQLIFTANLLEMAANQFSNNGCNDLPVALEAWFTQPEWDALNKEYHDWNGDPEEYKPGRILNHDCLWMDFMAKKLRKMAEGVQ
jgi:hypothetical protein